MVTASSIILYDCRPLSARITERQCQINKSSGHVSCGRCSGLIKENPVAGEDVVSIKPLRKCVKCGEEKPIIGRGMCGKCYHRAKFAHEFTPGKPGVRATPPATDTQDALDAIADKLPEPGESLAVPPPTSLLSLVPVAPVPAPSEKPGIFVDFSGHEGLLAGLKERSEDPGKDIIALLQLAFDGKLLRVEGSAMAPTPPTA